MRDLSFFSSFSPDFSFAVSLQKTSVLKDQLVNHRILRSMSAHMPVTTGLSTGLGVFKVEFFEENLTIVLVCTSSSASSQSDAPHVVRVVGDVVREH